ncbi:MAG: hypothetical protein M5R42_12680 [Rhodocyclaceae bacterium]|nr:hypothetical protein [Rhodocyclaceae bacterium]
MIVAMLANIFLQIPAIALCLSAIAVMIFSLPAFSATSAVSLLAAKPTTSSPPCLYLDILQRFLFYLHLLMAFAGE